MIEIGKQRIVPVRKREGHKLVPVLETDGTPKLKTVQDQVWRVTRDVLNGRFGRDKDRRLVVGLQAGDLLVMRPQGTQQSVSVELKEVYEWVLQRKANTAHMARLRERKAAKERARAAARQAYAEKRLTKAL